MMKLKNNTGFTLIEVIISVATLSIVSVILLQLFITSKDSDIRSHSIDIAGVYVANAIENTKAMSRHDLSSKYDIEQFFNKEWEAVDDPESGEFVLNLVAIEDKSVATGFYRINSKVYIRESEVVLVEYATNHYYHIKE